MVAIDTGTRNEIILDYSLVETNLIVNDRKEALKHMSDLLQKRGLVKDGFFEAIIAREKRFPTGIATKFMGVAIPHTFEDYVNAAGIAIAVLPKPVVFKNMVTNDDLDVSIIFMLAVKDAKHQVSTLQKLGAVFQNPATLKNVFEANTKIEIVEIVRSILDEEKL